MNHLNYFAQTFRCVFFHAGLAQRIYSTYIALSHDKIFISIDYDSSAGLMRSGDAGTPPESEPGIFKKA